MIAALISALFMTAVSPMTYTVIEDTCDLPLLNPELQNRKTAKICLSNGLEALIISDPLADQSAASLSVACGSWSDPIEYPGMAHFCEHMLFMGTKKYPSENGFSSNVADYAGQTNAFTAPEQTVYMFSAQTSGFLSLFDQFAHFFIDPLFNPSFIAKELHAVDQEFAKNLENDGWREYMIFKEAGNPNHPNRMFSTGNSETLQKIPQNALNKWHDEQYGAEKMHLVVYSPLPIEQLQEAVVQTFSEVPKSLQDPIDTRGPLSSLEQMGHITYIKPIKNRKSITLTWELPLELSEDPTQSADLLAFALKRGQKYSLYETLKDAELIDTMSIRVDDLGGQQHRFFQITLELTNRGLDEVDLAILRCFEALCGLKKTGIPAYFFHEKNGMAQLNYQYQARQNPFDYIAQLGSMIAEENLSTFPRNSLLSTQYDPDKIGNALSFLTPKNCMISLLASPELMQVPLNRREKWLGSEYAINPTPEKWLARWENAQPNENIRLAPPNAFLPENLALVPGTASTPIAIADSELGLAYYVRSPEFGVPNSIIHLHILSPGIQPSARSAVLTSLYIDHLTDLLHPTLAAASSAGLACSFDIDRSALHIELSGYSEKAPFLLQEVVKQMPIKAPTPEQFAIYVDRHEKAYLNGQKDLAAFQAKELIDSLVNQDKVTKNEKLFALKKITYEDFLDFHEMLFESTYIQALFAGNLTIKEAESAWLDVIHVLGKSPYPKEQHSQTKILHLPEESGPYRIAQKTGVQGNATLLLIDEGDFTYPKRAAQEILSSILKEAFFNELRTKQKTGYIAHSDGTEMEERLFQYFLVQSNSHQPEELLFRFEQFIESFNDSLEEVCSLERFETIKASLISSLKTRFRNLNSKTRLWDRLAFERDGDFGFVDKRLETLEALHLPEFFKEAKGFLNRQNRKRLAVLFEGRLASPYAYQSIHLPQVSEVATYAPRSEKKILRQSAAVSSEERPF